MSAGTLALTNNSTTVTGTNTTFQTDLAANDFIVCKIGGTTYTLGVSAVGSNTALTLTQPFTGPTTSGVAWTAVANQALVGITTELAANLTTVYRSVIRNDANWMQFFSNSGNITIVLRDGSTVTGPSWNSVSSSLAAKANTSDVLTKTDNLGSLADKAAGRTNLGWVNGALPVSLGGTGSATPFGTAANTFAQGNDSRLNTVDQKSGGTITSALGVTGNVTSTTTTYNYVSPAASATTSGSTKTNLFALAYVNPTQYYIQDAYLDTGDVYSRITVVNGSGSSIFYFGASGTGQAKTAWTTYSDRRVKTDIEVIQNALDKVSKLNGYTYKKFGQKQTGVIAQEVQEVLPEAITVFGSLKLESGETIEDVLSISPGDLTGLLIEATKELSTKIIKQDAVIAELQKRMKAVDGLDA